MNNRRVVITGLGAITPIGNNVKDFWEGLINGKSGAGPITYFDTEKFKTKFACELKGYDPMDYMDRKIARTNDPYVQYALTTTDEAIHDAGLDLEKIDVYRTGIIWGTGNGGIKSFEEGVMEYAKGNGTPRYNPYFIPKMLANMGAGVMSIHYGIKGVSFSPISACATSNTAIIEAYHHIIMGTADVIITGGSDAAIIESSIAGFNAAKALSTNNENPTIASRPYDKNRDGFVMGEGSGTLILEELGHALKRGAHIYAEIGGGAMTSDAYHLTSTHPEGEGAVRAMKLAIEQAGLSPSDIDYINCHATSTPAGDPSELKAVEKVFGEHKPMISATKSMTGHLLGGAGAIEAIASIKSIENSIIPPTINTKELDDDLPKNLNIVLGKAAKKEVNAAISNTFGFGGHNAIVLFKKFRE